MGTQIDVTERRRADEERERLRQAQADLAHLSRSHHYGRADRIAGARDQAADYGSSDRRKDVLAMAWSRCPRCPEAREAASRIVKDVTRAAEIISRISLLFKKGASAA